MRTDAKTKRLAFDAAFVCLALALSYLESFLPPFVFPGAKLGLTNIALTVCAYRYFVTDAAAVSFCRILISFLLFGNVTSLLFSIFITPVFTKHSFISRYYIPVSINLF